MNLLPHSIQQLKHKVADLADDLGTLETLLVVDVPSSLNKIRFITEKVLQALCKSKGVSWGQANPTLERMLGPLVAADCIPRNMAIHVRTIQMNTSPGSHYQELALSSSHVSIAKNALIEFLEWYCKQWKTASGDGEQKNTAARPQVDLNRDNRSFLPASTVNPNTGLESANAEPGRLKYQPTKTRSRDRSDKKPRHNRQLAERFVCLYAKEVDLPQLHSFYAEYFGGDVPSPDLMKAWISQYPRAFGMLYQVDDRSIKKKVQILVGSFKVLLVTQHAVRRLDAGLVSGSSFEPGDIASRCEDAAACYVGDVVAKTVVARGFILGLLNSTCEEAVRIGLPIYARPLSNDGLRIMTQYGFVQAADGKSPPELGKMCKLLSPMSGVAYP